ncbi:hypothetical protein [Sphaerothrix gracilis]|uniref:hypothetical protein n=1 Tax=Sphaerothrix gracilis TaxID=3151835 RepID=UPI0031FD73A1
MATDQIKSHQRNQASIYQPASHQLQQKSLASSKAAVDPSISRPFSSQTTTRQAKPAATRHSQFDPNKISVFPQDETSQPQAPIALQTCEDNILQPKYLRSDLKGLGSGNAGQWHQGDPNFHVTIFPDDKNFVEPHGFKFVSNRWVSEFHVTNHNPGKFGRRFYDIDTGKPIGEDKGKISGHDELALAFIKEISKIKSYTDEEALEQQNTWDLAAEKQDKEQREKIEKVVLEVASEYKGQELDWKKPQTFKVIGQISTKLRDDRIIDVDQQLLKEKFDEILFALNAEAERVREKSKEEEALKLQESQKEEEVPLKQEKDRLLPKGKQLAQKSSSNPNLTLILTILIVAIVLGGFGLSSIYE